uniref:Uncharacterized protein n=1 Tax=Glossina pallidipes TaxID=7398 RepID=A0A1A9ZS81_GLOPL
MVFSIFELNWFIRINAVLNFKSVAAKRWMKVKITYIKLLYTRGSCFCICSLYFLCQSRFCLVTVSPRFAASFPLYTITPQPITVRSIIILAKRIRTLLRQRSITSGLENKI